MRTASMERRHSMKPKNVLQRMSFSANRSMSLSRTGSENDNVNQQSYLLEYRILNVYLTLISLTN